MAAARLLMQPSQDQEPPESSGSGSGSAQGSGSFWKHGPAGLQPYLDGEAEAPGREGERARGRAKLPNSNPGEWTVEGKMEER